MTERRTDIRAVLIFTIAYLVTATVTTIVVGNTEFVFYIVTMLLLIVGIAVVHGRVSLSAGALWGLSIWGLAHMAGGLVPLPEGWPFNPPNRVLYSLWLIPDRLRYDQVVHAYGFAVTTWVCWQGLQAIARARFPSFGMLVLSGAASMGFGALNEVIEFAATRILPHTNVGGYLNTGWDLVSNLVGVVVAMILIAWLSRERGGPGAAPADEGASRARP